jgi:hypothetical protein
MLGSCSLAAVLVGGGAPAENINVSRIATGKNTPIDFAAEASLPEANDGATLSYFALGTAKIDSEPTKYFAIAPWSAAFQTAPTHPKLERVSPAVPYMQGNATFTYSPPTWRDALVDMKSGPKRVSSATAVDGHPNAQSAASYTTRIDHTGSAALDYFLELQVPTYDRSIQPAYDLCCAGDPNGGTYSYHRPQSAKARAAVDVYADGLPIWSSESIYRYPQLAGGSPFDEQDVSWGKDDGTGTSTLYLGRLAAGQSLTIALIARTNVNDKTSDCGIQDTSTPFGDPEFLVHCFDIVQGIDLKRGGEGAPVGYRIYSKHPPTTVSGAGVAQ